MCNPTQKRPLATALFSLPANSDSGHRRDFVPPNLADLDFDPVEAAHHA